MLSYIKTGKGHRKYTMIHLCKITEKNLWQVCGLNVREEQRNFVASNIESIAEAYAVTNDGGHAFPRAVYDDDTLIGFVMIGFGTVGEENESDTIKNNYSLWRLMIDEKYQGKGYFRPIMDSVIEFIRTYPCGKSEFVWLSYEKENEHAAGLYKKYGFSENGEMCGDEIMAVMKL